MHVCHVTPHLPPDQAANALLPAHLGEWAHDAGDEVSFIAHPARAGARSAVAGTVVEVPARAPGRAALPPLRPVRSFFEAWRMARYISPVIARADVVHVHSNGLLAEVGGLVARRFGKPVVLTLYGTEIWHYRKRAVLDLFTRLYRQAARVSFYSRGLLERAIEIGLGRPGLSVVYPPVADAFAWHCTEAQHRLRRELGLPTGPLLINVKRVHPLAGQRYLVEAMPALVARYPDLHLRVCGTGPLIGELTSLAARLGVASHVTFTGLVDNRRVALEVAAADLFVLPSLLEAMPTVAVEALAAGTPVVSADHPGGVELGALFPDDVRVVPRERPEALAAAIDEALAARRRTSELTRAGIEQRFRPRVVWAEFRALYDGVTTGERRGAVRPV